MRGLGAKLCVVFQIYSYFKKYEVSKLTSPCFLLNKNINFNKNEMKSKRKISHTVLKR